VRKIFGFLRCAVAADRLACLPASTVSAGTPAKVVVGLNSDVRNFDPVNTLDTTTDRVITHIYEYLFVRDHEMKIIPLLAESGGPWTI